MAHQIAYRHDMGSVPVAYEASSIQSANRPHANRPNINFEGSLNDRPISRAEIAILNAPDRTSLIAQRKPEFELPEDVTGALTQKPAFTADYSPDYSRVIAAALRPPEPLNIQPLDLRSFIVSKEPTGGGTAVGAEQDQQDCCNCCNLQ